MFSLIVCCVTGAAVFTSVLVKPYINIGKVRLGLFWIISVVGAAVLLFSGGVPLGYLAEELTASSSVNPLKILALFFGMTSLSVFLDEAGFFRYLANAALRVTGNNQKILFITVYALVSALTVFTSNDVVVLTFTPFICTFARRADIDPVPYLFAEFVAANTWSMLLIIGNPTNVYLSACAGIDFGAYICAMALPTVLAGAASFVILYILFRSRLKAPMTAEAATEVIQDKPSLILGVAHLALCTLLLALSSYLGFEMYLVAVAFALSLFACVTVISLCRRRPLTPVKASVKRLPYELIPFVLSMFVLVLALKYSGVTQQLSALLSSAPPIIASGAAAYVVSNVINNIPASVLFGAILGADNLPAVYAAIIGTNVGAFFTPVGALAGIMWVSVLKRFDVGFSFGRFVLYGAAVSLPALLAALGGLAIIF